MVGIVVDTIIIKLLIKKFIPDISKRIEEKDDFLGDFIGNNFINRGLINLFSNGMIDKDISLLIWDYLFIEGNIVLLKSFLAIYYYLSDTILNGEKSLEFYNDVINLELKKIDINNNEFIYNLFFRNEESISNLDFNDYRFNLSLQVADSLEENNIEHVKSKVKLSYDTLYDKQVDKALACNQKWPYCINDTYFENVTKIVFYTVFQEEHKNYIKNYFFSDKNNLKDKEKTNIEKNYYRVRVERRPHYCNNIQKEITQKEDEQKFINQKDIKQKEQINENIYEKSKKIDGLLNQNNYVTITKAIENKICININSLNLNNNIK